MIQKILILVGILFILIGVCLPWLRKFGFGHLPGDFIFKRDNFTIYFPLTTSILISVIVSIIFWLLQRH